MNADKNPERDRMDQRRRVEAQQRRRFAAGSAWRGGDRRTELAADERGSDGYCRAVKLRQTSSVPLVILACAQKGSTNRGYGWQPWRLRQRQQWPTGSLV